MIREANDGDSSALAGLERELFGSQAWSAAALLGGQDGPQRSALVATDQSDTVVGYVVTTVAGEVIDLLRIGVRPDHQRRGLGGILLAAALDEATAHPEAARMLLEVEETNAAALALYHGHAFAIIDRRRRYYADGTDALILQRQLGPGL